MKMKIRNCKSVKGVFILLLIASLTACQSQRTWMYTANHWEKQEKNEHKLTIPTFIDDRSDEEKKFLFMYLIPLVPFGWQESSTPELMPRHVNSGAWTNYDPKRDFARALVQEVMAGTPFKEVVYSANPVRSGYYLQGRILNTDYKEKMFSYGLTYVGSLFWYLGAPASRVCNNLSIELVLYGPDNKIIFQKTYEAEEYKKTSWRYKLRSDMQYSEMLQEIYAEFIQDLNRALKNTPL